MFPVEIKPAVKVFIGQIIGIDNPIFILLITNRKRFAGKRDFLSGIYGGRYNLAGPQQRIV
jgi:hypothetical protein